MKTFVDRLYRGTSNDGDMLNEFVFDISKRKEILIYKQRIETNDLKAFTKYVVTGENKIYRN